MSIKYGVIIRIYIDAGVVQVSKQDWNSRHEDSSIQCWTTLKLSRIHCLIELG